MVLEGKVATGLGVAKKWVSKIDSIFEAETGMKVFHGTLNIILESDYIVKPDWIIKPSQYGGTQNVLVQKCKIMDTVAYIVRAEKNQLGKGDHDLKVIEIISDISFRKQYRLKDNDTISIQV